MGRRLYTTVQWRRVRLEVLERDGWRCRIRGEGCTGEANEVDHIVSLAHGGDPYDPSGLRAACSFCNRSRGGRLGNQRRQVKERTVYPPKLEW